MHLQSDEGHEMQKNETMFFNKSGEQDRSALGSSAKPLITGDKESEKNSGSK